MFADDEDQGPIGVGTREHLLLLAAISVHQRFQVNCSVLA
jgi:hypothetical protein